MRALGALVAWPGCAALGMGSSSLILHVGSFWVFAQRSEEISGNRSGVQGLTEAGLCEPPWHHGCSLKGSPAVAGHGVRTDGLGRPLVMEVRDVEITSSDCENKSAGLHTPFWNQ